MGKKEKNQKKKNKVIKKKTIQKELVIEFLITIILVAIFSIVGFYIFVHNEVSKIIEINIQNYEEMKELLTIIRRGIIIILLNSLVISTIIIKIGSKKLLGPLEKTIQATKKVAQGDFDVRLQTKRKDETEEFVNNFNYMVKELGKTELLQKDFIDNVSHEIKTPISSIQGFAKLLDDENISSEERKEYIGIIIEESERLLKLSNSTLKLAKLQHQDKITKKEQINITEQIRKVLAVLEPKWREKNLKVDISLNNIYFEGDEDLLFQVWMNLIDNAIKFSNNNGKIHIKIEEIKDNIEIEIKDNGIGMEKEDIEKIYSRFYQVDKSHSGEGSGLGLSIVKRIIELSSGTIDIKSEKNKGTKILIALPKIKKEEKIEI